MLAYEEQFSNSTSVNPLESPLNRIYHDQVTQIRIPPLLLSNQGATLRDCNTGGISVLFRAWLKVVLVPKA